MELVCAPSRAGPLFCRAGTLYLNSPYDPEREAQRWLAGQIGERQPTCIVLIAPCLDYLSPILRRRWPRSSIVSLQPSAYFRACSQGGGGNSWYPDSPSALSPFLDAAIGEDEVSGILVLEWPPGAQAFPEVVATQRAALRSSLDRLTGSLATVKSYGRQWFANACRSFLLAERVVEPPVLETPVVLAAAGPSLVAALRTLSPYRERFTLIAVSSALTACTFVGMTPDLVVSTDGGFWSRAHLYPFAQRGAALATPLTALPSSQLWQRTDLLLLDQGSFVECALLPLLGGGLPLPSHGTVSGTALHLAERLSAGPLVFAGLDLAVKGEREHASPHAFDALAVAHEGRLSPLAGSLFARILANVPLRLGQGPWHASRSLASYAQALSENAAGYSGSLYRLFPSPVAIPGMATIEASELERLFAGPLSGPLAFHPKPGLPATQKRVALGSAFATWKDQARDAARRLAEGQLPQDAATRELYRAFDLPDWAAARRACFAGADPRPSANALELRTAEALADVERRLLG